MDSKIPAFLANPSPDLREFVFNEYEGKPQSVVVKNDDGVSRAVSVMVYSKVQDLPDMDYCTFDIDSLKASGALGKMSVVQPIPVDSLHVLDGITEQSLSELIKKIDSLKSSSSSSSSSAGSAADGSAAAGSATAGSATDGSAAAGSFDGK